MGYYDDGKITTSSDTEQIGLGDIFYAIVAYGTPEMVEFKGTITEIDADGDVDDEGRGYGYYTANGVLDDGREVSINQRGEGTIYGANYRSGDRSDKIDCDTQAQSNAFYDAFDAYKAGQKLTFHQKGLLIGGMDVASTTTGCVNPAQAVQIAKILGDYATFAAFDMLAGSGGKRADEYGAYKVRQARNMNVDGRAIFFDALAEASKQ